MKPKPTITDVIEAAIQRSSLTRYRLAKLSGLTEASLSRFMSGKTSMILSKADKLASVLGLMLVPDPDATAPEPTPEKQSRPRVTTTGKGK